MDTSIIIQGPLHPLTIGTIPFYKKFGEVIVSCWENDSPELLNSLPGDIKLVVSPYPRRPMISRSNIHLQTISTLNGLLCSTGEMCIKVRSDESYSDLSCFIDAMREHPDKVCCGNVYFRKEYPLHMSDHLFGTAKWRMVQALEWAKEHLETNKPFTPWPEVILTTAFLTTFGVFSRSFDVPNGLYKRGLCNRRTNTPDEALLLYRHFFLVPMRMLGKFICRVHTNDEGRVWLDREDRNILEWNGSSIYNSIDELLPKRSSLKM